MSEFANLRIKEFANKRIYEWVVGHLSFVICHWSIVTQHATPVTFYALRITHHALRITHHALRITLYVLATLLLFACAPTPTSPFTIHHSPFTITAPRVATAGQPVSVTITAPDAPDDTRVTLTAVGSYGAMPFTAPLTAGKVTFTLPSTATAAAGLVTLTATAGDATAAVELTLRPGPAAGQLPLLVGPRSIAANGRENTMAVALPQDSLGNPLPDGSPVAFVIQHPAPYSGQTGWRQLITATTRGGVAWALPRSGIVAGETALAAHTGDSRSAALTFVETAGRPLPFNLTTDRDHLPADGRQLVRVTTSPLVDAFGNPLPDGISLTFLVASTAGERRSIPAFTLGGRAQAEVQAPLQPGKLTVQADLAGVLSEPLSLTFVAGPAVSNFPVKVDRLPDSLTITAGPLVGPLGQFVPDGTPVRFSLTGPGEPQRHTAPAEFGLATLTLRRAALSPGSYIVTVRAGTGRGHASFKGP